MDNGNSAELKIELIRDTYQIYCGKFCDKDEIDRILSQCSISKSSMIKYSQFISKKSETQMSVCKEKVRKTFDVYDQKRTGLEYFS